MQSFHHDSHRAQETGLEQYWVGLPIFELLVRGVGGDPNGSTKTLQAIVTGIKTLLLKTPHP